MGIHNKPFTIIFTIIILCFTIGQDGHTQETDYKNQSIYATYGTVIFSSQVSFAFDRTVYKKEHLRVKLKLNFGKYADKYPDFDEGERKYKSYYGLSGVMVFGAFEASLGVASARFTLAKGDMPNPEVNYDDVMNGLSVQGNVGIRIERGEFLFRAGIGNLELLYIGIGINF